MADVIEDLELIVTRAINYLTRILFDLCRRLNENSHRPLNRRTLVRWLAAFMPTPRQPRLRLQTDLAVTGPPALERWASCGSLGSAFSSVSIHHLVEEDLGGNIVRYRRGFGDEDIGGEAGFEDSTFLPSAKVQDFLALTSTPKFCSASSNCSVISGDLTSRGKLVEMEEELAALRKQIAMLVLAQESSTYTSTVTVADREQPPKDTNHAADLPLPASPVLTSLDDSGCESEVVSRKPDLPCISEHVSESHFVAPAPPLPLPVQCKQSSCVSLSLQQQLQQKKRSLSSTDDRTAAHRKSSNPRTSIPDMVTVLKDIGSVKLRAIERSPGGTPIKRRIEREPTDPAAIIAQALKKKFSSHWGFSSESDKENDSSSFASDHSTSFGQHTIMKTKKRLNVHDSSDSWTPVASPLKV